jgi:hypothetical protein
VQANALCKTFSALLWEKKLWFPKETLTFEDKSRHTILEGRKKDFVNC